jgi:Cellulose biosynthesis GIL
MNDPKATTNLVVNAKSTAASAPVDAIIFAIELGIFGMPEFSSNMISGGLYALKVGTSSARFPLLSSSLQSAIRAGLPCTIVTASAPDELLQRLELYGDFSAKEVLADGRLVVYSMQEEFSKKMFRYGADRLTQELIDFKVPERSFLLFDQADDLLSLHDFNLASQQIKIIAKWFKQRQITGLMSFSRSSDQKLDTLNTLMDYLTGIARLGGDRDGLELTFQYWRASPGVIAARNFNLYQKDTGVYAVSRREVERVPPQPQPQAQPPVQALVLPEAVVSLEIEDEVDVDVDVDANVDALPELEVVAVEAARPTTFSYRDGNGGTPFAIPDRKDADAAKNTTAVHKVVAKAKRSSMAS